MLNCLTQLAKYAWISDYKSVPLPFYYFFQSTAGYEWYVQVIFVIGPANRVLHNRYTRDLHGNNNNNGGDGIHGNEKNGTNMQVISLDRTALDGGGDGGMTLRTAVLSSVIPGLVVLVLCVVLCCILKHRIPSAAEAIAATTMMCTGDKAVVAEGKKERKKGGVVVVEEGGTDDRGRPVMIRCQKKPAPKAKVTVKQQGGTEV